MGFEESSVFFI